MTSPLLLIRPYRDDDPIPSITRLLHEAYAPLAATGLRYTATHQDDATTNYRSVILSKSLVPERR